MITLQPVAMVTVTAEFIYAPSRLLPARQVSEADFLNYFADGARCILVSFEQDGCSNPQRLTAYGFGFDCWYIVGGES